MESPPSILTVNDLMKELRIGKTMAYSLVESNKIGHIRIGREYRIPRAEFEAYVKRNTVARAKTL